MTAGITNDPDDPGQPRLASYVPLTGVQVLQQHIEPVLRFTQPAIVAYEREGQDIEKNLTAFLLYSFVAETGLKPSQCVLVSKRVGTGFECYFTPGEQHRHHTQMVDALRAEVQSLRQQVDELRLENKELRWRR